MIVLFIFTLLGYILGQVGRIQLENNIAFSILDCSVFLLVSYWVFTRVRKKKMNFVPQLLELLTIGFIAIGFISLVLSPLSLTHNQFITSFLYVVRLLFYGSVYYVIADLNTKQKSLVLIGQLIAGVAIVLLGFIQYIYYPFLRNLYYLGWDEHLYRLFSTFLDPNFAGSFFVLFFLLLCGFFFNVVSKHVTKATVGYGVLILITLLAIFLTYSRTAFLMLLVGSAVFFIIKKQWKLMLAGIIGFILLFALFANTQFEGLNPFRVASALSRVESAQNALSIFEKYPLLGVGFNAYRYAQFELGLKQETVIPNHADAGTDNSFLFVLATTGGIGFIFFVSFLLIIITQVIRGVGKKDMMHEVFLSSLIAVMFGSLFNNILFYPAILLWLVVLGGLIPKE